MTEKLDWTTLSAEEKIAAIRPLWSAGETARDIMGYFVGATRNSIIGALSRAKLPSRAHARKPTVNPSTHLKPKPRVARKPLSAQPGTPPIVQKIPEPDTPSSSLMAMIEGNRPPLAGTTPISILDLPSRSGVLCRWPVIGGYCGAKSGDKVFCETHARIAYTQSDHKIRVPKGVRL